MDVSFGKTGKADDKTLSDFRSLPSSKDPVIVFMGVMIWADRFRTDTSTRLAAQRAAASNAGLPTTDWSYWVVMLAAGVLGTALGDWLADAGLGVYWASLIGMPFFVAAVWAAYRFGLSKPWYWIAIAIVNPSTLKVFAVRSTLCTAPWMRLPSITGS